MAKRDIRQVASKGGRARASVLLPEERSEIARQAAIAKWRQEKGPDYEPPPAPGPEIDVEGVLEPDGSATRHSALSDLPFSMFRGKLPLGNVELECHVLSNGKRVFTQREVVRALSGGRDSGNLGAYLERNPLIPRDFLAGATDRFVVPGNPTPAIGQEATTLIEICESYLSAHEQGLLKTNQYKLAIQAGIIMRACAKVGIIALIDEVTGFQRVREERALRLKLQAFIADEIQEWARMFPDEFWFELARLEGIRYSPRNRPLRWGKYVMAFVYDAIDQDVGKKLRELNPNPHFLKNHHQWLKQFGRGRVNDQIQRVIAVMKLCDDMDEFRKKFKKVFQKSAIQQFTFDDIGWGTRPLVSARAVKPLGAS